MLPIVAEALVWALAFFGPLALATAPGWAAIGAMALAASAFLVASVATRSLGRSLEVPALGLILLAVCGIVALQLLPLPPAMLRLLSARAYELFEFTLGPVGRYPAWRPISLDPPGTALVLGRLGTILLAYLAAVQIGGFRGGRTRLTLALGLSGLTVALIGYGHALLRLDALFGVYHFSLPPAFLTTFGNVNHAASLLSIGAFAMLGLAWSASDNRRVLEFGAAYVLQAVAIVLTLSRSGIIAFFAAHLVFVALAQWSRGKHEGRAAALPRAILAPVALSIALAVAAYLGWEAVAGRFGAIDTVSKLRESKIAVLPSVLPMIRDYWSLGVGRGAFASAFQRYQPIATHTINYPENWIVQQVSELGLLAGIGVVLALVWAWLGAAFRRNELGATLGCVCGAFAVGLHDLADFGSELGGVAIPLGLALAVATCRTRPPDRAWRLAGWRWLAFGGIISFGLFLGIIWGSSNSLASDASRLGVVQTDGKAAERLAEILAARHPADYYVPLTVAVAFAHESPLRPEKVLPWANRAMYLNPQDPWPHRIAARSLLRLGRREQAELEYRLALASIDADVLSEIMDTFRRPEDLLAAVPDDPRFVRALLELMERPGKRELGLAVGELFVARGGNDAPVLPSMAELARSLGLYDKALGYAESALARDATAPRALLAKAQALSGLGRTTDASKAAADAISKSPADLDLAIAVAPILTRSGQGARAREWLTGALPYAKDHGLRARGLAAEAQTFMDEKSMGRAIDTLRAATQMAPGETEVHWTLISWLETGGRLHEALREVDALAPFVSSEGAARIDAARARLQSRLEEVRLYHDIPESHSRSRAGGSSGADPDSSSAPEPHPRD